MKNDIILIIRNTTIQKFLIAVLIAYIMDFLTGFSKAWSNKNIQSNKLRKGVAKFIEYVAFITIGIMLDFLFGLKGFTISCCITIILIEIRSLMENVEETNIKKTLNNFLNIISKNKEIENGEDLNEEEYEINEEITEDDEFYVKNIYN